LGQAFILAGVSERSLIVHLLMGLGKVVYYSLVKPVSWIDYRTCVLFCHLQS
jgi:hypothetical protein